MLRTFTLPIWANKAISNYIRVDNYQIVTLSKLEKNIISTKKSLSASKYQKGVPHREKILRMFKKYYLNMCNYHKLDVCIQWCL